MNNMQVALVIAIRFLISALAWQLTDGLRFTSIQMPALVQRATNFWLVCQFELAQGQQLYSVKWYKNNEEFYRLLMATSGAPTSASASGPGSNLGLDLSRQMEANSGDKYQQQYFSQAGVNVLMSGSNATHVRLLNASLESEGVYACEISSENLSTIRHEKEIKVYVLPHLKLSVIGLRSLYSLGDRVELHCSSDFSRPSGALAWFINGQRITQNSRPFELDWRRTSEKQLQRGSLALKFKLTDALLAGANQEAAGSQLRNQSLKLSSTATTTTTTLQQANKQQLELLKLECRFKLTDVSDVTFNELKVGRSLDASSHQAQSAGRLMGARARQSGRSLSRRSLSSVAAAAAAHERGRLRVFKSHGQQVIQAPSQSQAARKAHALRPILLANHAADSCQLGPMALQLDDPIILDTDFNAGGRHDEHDRRELKGDESQEAPEEAGPNEASEERLELAEGTTLDLNCSTLGALLAEQLAERQQQQQQQDELASSRDRWPLAPRRRKFSLQTGRIGSSSTDQRLELGHKRGSDIQAQVCVEPNARRRSLISGKYQTQSTGKTSEEIVTTGGGQQRTAAQESAHKWRNRQLQIAYVKLDGAELRQLHEKAAESAARWRQQQQQVTKSLAQLEQQQQQQHDQWQWQLRAPPLLEWFINNQEAPKSSASYSPELPLTPASSVELAAAAAATPTRNPEHPKQLGGRLDAGSPGGTPTGASLGHESPLLPSIDYAQYFANFDARPLEQQLKLSLKLDKKHFMNSDSQLTLRCTSTQAQVLMTDSISLSFLVAPPNGLLANESAQINQVGAPQGTWQQRPMAANNQIKQKYLHQYARSSDQKFPSPALNSNANYPKDHARAASTQLVAANNAGATFACTVPSISVLLVLVLSHWAARTRTTHLFIVM